MSRFFSRTWMVVLLAVAITVAKPSIAQRNSFVYIQSDDQQPFYVTLNGRNISSSSIGYLILPKLQDGTVSMKLGFPNNANVQEYDIDVKGNDQGFLIKNFGEKGWGLFNLQSMDVQMSGTAARKRGEAEAATKLAAEKRIADSMQLEEAKAAQIRKADSIKNVLALQTEQKRIEDSATAAQATIAAATKAAEDKLALEKQQADQIAREKLDAEKKAAEKLEKDKLAAAATTEEKANQTILPVSVAVVDNNTGSEKKAEEIKKPVTKKIGEIKSDSGVAVVYKDGVDTVKAFIPSATAQANEIDDTIVIKLPAKTDKENAASKLPSSTGNTTAGTTTPRFLDMEINHDSSLVATKEIDAAPEQKKQENIPVPVVEPKNAGKEKKPSGLTANNSNTKIVAVPVVEETQTAAEVVKSDENASSKKDTVVKEKKTGLSSNNSNTKIITTESPKETDAAVSTVPEKAVADASKKGSETKVTGLSSNNSSTRIVTVPVVQSDAPAGTSLPVTTVEKKDTSAVTTAIASSNLNCKELATDKDFYNTRKKIVMSEDADEMVMNAKRAFKEKCYSTAQVRNLCVLFLSDKDRYSFLDAAYPYTSDAENFAGLSDLLKDNYFLNRFKAMLK